MSYSLRFIIREDKPNKQGQCPIYLRYTFNRKYKNISTGYVIPSNSWNKEEGVPKSKYKDKQVVISVLDKKKVEVNSIINNFRLREERFPNCDELIENLIKGKLENDGLDSLYKEFIEFKKGKNVENSTVGIYNYTWKKWKSFEELKNKKFTIKELHTSLLEDFKTYLMSLELQPNSIGKYIKTLKTFLNYLIVYKKLEVPIDYKEIKVDREEGSFEVFTKRELEILKKAVSVSRFEQKNYELDNEYNLTSTEHYVGRIMVFLCSTGLSYVDLSRLMLSDFVIEEKDYETQTGINIKITRQKLKTNDICVIPILDDTLDFLWVETLGYYSDRRGVFGSYSFEEKVGIFKRHINFIGLEKNIDLRKKLFPQFPKLFFPISNQVFNREIKEVCRKIGITSQVKKVKIVKNKTIETVVPKYSLISSHTGRRTFITLSLNQNIRPDILMKTTGHKKFETMKRYTKITDKYVNKEFSDKIKLSPDLDIINS